MLFRSGLEPGEHLYHKYPAGCQNSFGLDAVLCGAKGADRVFPILAASVLWDALAVVGTVKDVYKRQALHRSYTGNGRPTLF